MFMRVVTVLRLQTPERGCLLAFYRISSLDLFDLHQSTVIYSYLHPSTPETAPCPLPFASNRTGYDRLAPVRTSYRHKGSTRIVRGAWYLVFGFSLDHGASAATPTHPPGPPPYASA